MFNFWHKELDPPKEEKIKRTDTCLTCKYELLGSDKEPCVTCLGYLQVRPSWEAKERDECDIEKQKVNN